MNHTTTEERDALRAAARNYATPQELAAATGATIGKARRAFEYNEMVDRGERPRRPGRDAGIIDGDYVTAYLPPRHQAFAFRYGGNNRSAGIRRAIEEAMARATHCGHSPDCIVATDGGTNHCAECEATNRPATAV